jgi:CRP-like cAMP-binding protein
MPIERLSLIGNGNLLNFRGQVYTGNFLKGILVFRNNLNHQAMSQQLYDHIGKYVEVNEKEFPEILDFFEPVSLKKKEYLVQAGAKCAYNYFVLKGCLNMYFENEKGMPQTVQFAIENWWISDYRAFAGQMSTEFYIQAVERSKVLRISYTDQELLLNRFPYLEKYFRNIYQIAYGASLMRIKHMYAFSKEEIYLHFTEKYPEFGQRVPQYLIASFLGLTPEYVSEIRRKKLS